MASITDCQAGRPRRLRGVLVFVLLMSSFSAANGQDSSPQTAISQTQVVVDDADNVQCQRAADVDEILSQVSFLLRSTPTSAEDSQGPDETTAIIDEPMTELGELDSDAANSTGASGVAKNLDGTEVLTPKNVKHRWEEGSFDWVFRQGNNGLGMFSLQSTSSRDLDFDDPSNLDINFEYSIHFLSGPLKTDLPPRLFDLYFNVHWLQQLGDGFGVDANFDLGLFTDFEDSVRKGWRYPGRALAFWNLDGEQADDEVSQITLMGGIEFYDTARLRTLPAGGVIFQPTESSRYELYFPRPQVKWRLSHGEESDTWLYIRGDLMANAWAIERQTGEADVATLREKRIAIGLETRNWKAESDTSFLEVGYVFDRHLEYHSGRGNLEPSNAMMFRMGARY